MSTTPAGIFFLLLALFLFLKRRNTLMNLLLLCATADLFIEMGYSFIIMGTSFTHYDFCLFCLFSYCFLGFCKRTFRPTKTLFTLNILYVLPIIILLVFPSDVLIADSFRVTWDDVLSGASPVHPAITNRVLKYTLCFIFSSFIAYSIFVKFSWDNYRCFIIRFSKVINVFLFLGIIEFVLKNVLGNISLWGNVTEFFFGESSSTVFEARLRGNSYELNLFTKEASHYAYTLFLCLVVKLTSNILIGKPHGLSLSIFVCMFLMVLSTSFSTVMFLSAFWIIYLLYRWYVLCPKTMRYEKVALFITAVFGFSSVVAYLSANDDAFVIGRFLNFMDNWEFYFDINNTLTLGDGSTYVRIMSVMQTFFAFGQRPLWGFSLGALACHGATAMFLSGIGIVGVYYWTKFYFFTFSIYKARNGHKYIYLALILIYFLVNLLNSVGLRPFYDMSLITVIVCYNIIIMSTSIKSK